MIKNSLFSIFILVFFILPFASTQKNNKLPFKERYVRQGYKVMRYDHTHPNSSKSSEYDEDTARATLLHSTDAIFRILYKGEYYPFVPQK